MCVREKRIKKGVLAFQLRFLKNQYGYGSSGSWWDSEYILKIVPVVFTDTLDT